MFHTVGSSPGGRPSLLLVTLLPSLSHRSQPELSAVLSHSTLDRTCPVTSHRTTVISVLSLPRNRRWQNFYLLLGSGRFPGAAGCRSKVPDGPVGRRERPQIVTCAAVRGMLPPCARPIWEDVDGVSRKPLGLGA